MRSCRYILRLLIILVVFLSFGTDASLLTSISEESASETPLLFLGNMNISPVVYLEGGTPKGVAVDIVQALAPHLSRPIEIKAMNWPEAQSLVAEGKADALIQINMNEERLKVYDFSETLLESQFSIFTTSDTVGLSGVSSLHGLRVGVEAKGLPYQVLKKEPEISLIFIPNFLEGFNQLSEGSLDAVVVDYRVGTYILAKNGIQNIKVSGEPIASSNSSIAVKKGDTELLNEINTALKEIKADGTYDSILEIWRPTEGRFQTREQLESISFLLILILCILFLVTIVWIITLKLELSRRKVAERRSIENEEKFRVLFEKATDAVLVYDVDLTRFIDANLNAEELFGWTREELITFGPTDLFPDEQKNNPSIRESIREHIILAMKGGDQQFDRIIQRKNGEKRYCEVRLVQLPSADRKLIRASYIDITRRIKEENELIQYRDKLEELVKERTSDLQFAKEQAEIVNKKLNLLSSITRHDIGNELQMIFGYLDLALEGELTQKTKEYIENAYNSAVHIRRQLAFTRDYEDIGVHSPIWQDIQGLLNQVARTIDLHTVQLFIDIQNVEVFADPLMEKVFYNLIDNAKRYGEKLTQIHIYGVEESGIYTIICEDDGVGVPVDLKKKIFNRQYYQHTGFGLNLSQEILTITGLSIRECGTPGEGARFEIVIPAGMYRFTEQVRRER